MLDEELLVDVGYAFYSRSLSIILATTRQALCPHCHETFQTSWQWDKRHDQMRIRCPFCNAWEIRGVQYRKSIEHDNLAAMMALPIFQRYIEQWPRATKSTERMLLIDQLIHAFHWGAKQQAIPHRSTANNLIEGSHADVIAFLDHLAYGAGSTPALRATYAEWHAHARHMEELRQTPRQQRASLLTSKEEKSEA
jgi:hypothetical protein